MSITFALTPEESIVWDTMKRPFFLSTGEANVRMLDAFVKAAKEGYPSANAERDYQRQIPELFVFLKKNPEYLDEFLPVIYKSNNAGYKTKVVRNFLNDVHEQAPHVLATVLPRMFSTEKALGMQIPLLMDMAQYMGPDVFQTLDFKLLLKATPEKLLKALTPVPATWDPLMRLAKGLHRNEATRELAHSIACRVGLQVSISQSKDQKAPGVNQYDWALMADFWKKHEWQWNAAPVLSLFQLQAKGVTMVSDMVASFATCKPFDSVKANEALDWVLENIDAKSKTGISGIDQAVVTMYQNAQDSDVRGKCLNWFNACAENLYGWQYLWRVMPPQDAVKATKKMVDDYLIPSGITKAMLLSGDVPQRLAGQLPSCGTRLYTTLNHSHLPLGDVDQAMRSVLNQWCKLAKDTSGYDSLKYNVESVFDTLVHGMQEPMRHALQQSNGFKQLVLYTAYLQDIRKEDWDRYRSTFMPQIMERPLSLLATVYPEHQEAWAQLQQRILEGNFKREDTVHLIAKVLFNQNLNVADIQNTCTVLDCTPEVFFCSLQAPSEELFIPDSFDFSEVSPL